MACCLVIIQRRIVFFLNRISYCTQMYYLEHFGYVIISHGGYIEGSHLRQCNGLAYKW